MSKRHSHYYLVDHETGAIVKSNHVRVDWDGSIREEKQCDGKHPDYMDKRYPEPLEPKLISFPGTAAVYGPRMVTATSLTAYGTVAYYSVGNGLPDSENPPRQRG